jgi:hypothetical protein
LSLAIESGSASTPAPTVKQGIFGNKATQEVSRISFRNIKKIFKQDHSQPQTASALALGEKIGEKEDQGVT